jgi:DNA polymerase I
MKVWLLIDGNNWYARDYFASAGSAATNFLRRLDDCRRLVGPQLERVAVAWDSPSFRHQLREGYKAGRSEKPEGFGPGLARLRTALENESTEQLQRDGFEADDIIASMASTAVDEGCQAIIASSDHDLHQALRPGWVNQAIGFNRPRMGEFRADWITAESILNLYGVHPWQWIDYRVLTGDTSDNVLGCPGVGPKTAATILAACGTLKGFFDEPFKPAISPRLRSIVIAFRPMVEQLREIHALRTDLIFESEAVR